MSKYTFIIILFSPIILHAQQQTDSIAKHKKNIFTLALYKQPGKDSMVDAIDGIYRILKINKDRTIEDTSTKTIFSVLPGVEYNMATGFSASLNANWDIPKLKSNTNKSLIYSELKLTQKKQVVAQLASNLWFQNGDYNITTNWSFMKYPQLDFGLGSNSDLHLVDSLDYQYLKLHQSISKRIGNDLYIGTGLNIDYYFNIVDTTKFNKPLYGFREYGLTKSSNSSGWLVSLLYDTRKSAIMPVANSSFLNVVFRNNVTWLGSTTNWASLTVDARKYLPFPMGSNNILAFWTYNQFTLSGKSPYLDMPYTASDDYKNFGRGYIQGRFRGNNLMFAETEYRFGITENGSLGGVVFANAQALSAFAGQPIKGVMPGVGAGIRMKFNKHSKTNVAIDYAIGQGGSHGIFMNLGEVF
jgi:hypothetical protein